jgi:hypothetical protein
MIVPCVFRWRLAAPSPTRFLRQTTCGLRIGHAEVLVSRSASAGAPILRRDGENRVSYLCGSELQANAALSRIRAFRLAGKDRLHSLRLSIIHAMLVKC